MAPEIGIASLLTSVGAQFPVGCQASCNTHVTLRNSLDADDDNDNENNDDNDDNDDDDDDG